jgi:hypothetical protein
VRHPRGWVLKVRAEGEKLALLRAARQRCYELSVSSAQRRRRQRIQPANQGAGVSLHHASSSVREVIAM